MQDGSGTVKILLRNAVNASTFRNLIALDGLIGVITGAIADVEGLVGCSRDGHAQTMECSAGFLMVRIVTQQILWAKILAHLGKGLVEASRAGVEAFASGLLGKSNERMFPADVAAGAGLNGHVDDAVNQDLVAQGLLQRPGIGSVLSGVATVGDQHQHLAPIFGTQALRSKIDRVIERRRIAATQ